MKKQWEAPDLTFLRLTANAELAGTHNPIMDVSGNPDDSGWVDGPIPTRK